MTVPDPNDSPRRQARLRAERAAGALSEGPRHARRARRVRGIFGAAAGVVLLVGAAVSITAALTGPVLSDATGEGDV